MKTLHENYRDFEFKRFVFMGGPEGAPEPEAPVVEPEAEEAKIREEALSDNKFQKHAKDAKNKVADLESAYALSENDNEAENLAELNIRLAELNEALDAELNELKTSYDKDLSQLNSGHANELKKVGTDSVEDVQDLIKDTQVHIDTSGVSTEDIEAHQEAAQKAEVKPAAPVEGEQSEAEKAATAEASELTPEQVQEAKGRFLEQVYNQGNMKETLLTYIESKSDAKTLPLAEFQKEIEGSKLNDILDTFLSGLSADKIEKYLGGEPLSPEDFKTLSNAFAQEAGLEGIEYANKKEIALIHELEIEIPREKGGERTKTMKFSEVFGKNVAASISMKYEISEIKEGENKGKLQYRKNGSKEEPTLLVNTTDLLEGDMKAKAEAIARGEFGHDGEDFDKAFKELDSIANGELKTLAEAKKLEAILANPDSVEGLKKMGPLELIKMLARIAPMLLKALKSGDHRLIGDLIADLTTGNPAEIGDKIDSANDAYKKGVEEIAEKDGGVNDLLAMYHDPYDATAAKNNFPGLKYRFQLKEQITTKFTGTLGMDSISTIKKAGENATVITASRGSKTFEFRISKDTNGETVVNKAELIEDDDGNKDRVNESEKKVARMSDISGETTYTPTESPETETAKLKGVNGDYVGEDGAIDLSKTKGGKDKIHDVLESNVDSATITVGSEGSNSAEGVEGLPEGSQVLVKAGKEGNVDTFVVESVKGVNGKPDQATITNLIGKRLYVHNGDKVSDVKMNTETT